MHKSKNKNSKNINKSIRESMFLMWTFGIMSIVLSYFGINSVSIPSIMIMILLIASIIGISIVIKNNAIKFILFESISSYIVSISNIIISIVAYMMQSRKGSIYFVFGIVVIYIAVFFLSLVLERNRIEKNKKNNEKKAYNKEIVSIISLVGVILGGVLVNMLGDNAIFLIIVLSTCISGYIFELVANLHILSYLRNRNSIN